MDPDKIIFEILQQFKRLEREDVRKWTQTQWTSEILTALCKTGKESFGYSVYASSRFVDKDHKTGNKEWVYDLTWYEPDDSDRLKSIPLVAECEWSYLGEIIDDFLKILVARATVRVMVFDGKHSDDRARGVVNKLCRLIKAFEGGQKGDTYLLVGYEEDDKGWRFRYFKVVAQEPGNKPTIGEIT